AGHPNVGASLVNLALFYRDQGNNAAAEPLYKRALEIYEKALGSGNPRVADTLEGVAELLRKMGRNAEAQRMETRARSIRAR
ncbi:MAG: hypothetical protein HW416_3499, partial [Chloroflexi bacterium]|nr:hypothetical protein [Chloroflexota bacterium]